MELGNQDFFGKDGTARWFLGQVPLGQEVNKTNISKWGDRVQVRILGSDPSAGTELNNQRLRWAMVLKPGSHGTLNQGSTGIIGGEWVIGIFLDDARDTCMILGVLGRSDPKYYVKYDDQEQAGSTEFKPTYNYWGAMTEKVFQTSGGPDTPVGLATITTPPYSDWMTFNKPTPVGIAT